MATKKAPVKKAPAKKAAPKKAPTTPDDGGRGGIPIVRGGPQK